MFIHSGSSLENNTRFQPKMGKVIALFSDQNSAKPYPLGRHTPLWLELHKGVPTGLVQKSENYAAFEHGFPLVAFKFYAAKRQSFR